MQKSIVVHGLGNIDCVIREGSLFILICEDFAHVILQQFESIANELVD